MAILLIQVLGNSDVVFEQRPGAERLHYDSLELLQREAKEIVEICRESIESVNFPLIQAVNQQLLEEHPGEELIFFVILTNQTVWMSAQNSIGDGWKRIIGSDGFWWESVLQEWCKSQEIECFTQELQIGPDTKHGAADWEGMAKKIPELLAEVIDSTPRTIGFVPPKCPKSSKKILSKIYIQHSSGTPALSSALYLWGIEQQLARNPLSFLYVNVKDTTALSHSGNIWRRRLKLPILDELLSIQDFTGALSLVNDDSTSNTVKELRKLERISAFNLTDLILESPYHEAIERVAIAIWSERCFRRRQQWMSWVLRLAGAFELAIQLLIIFQGEDRYTLQRKETDLGLVFHFDGKPIRPPASRLVSELLTHGKVNIDGGEKLTVEKVSGTNEWTEFTNFYSQGEWKLSKTLKTDFLKLRNSLYHSLAGDRLDQIFDSRTKSDTGDHPADYAVNQLQYILQLAQINDVVKERVRHYQERELTLRKNLKSHGY